ncbi:MAG: hypothetical protein IIV16_01785 [Alistipes sp.]|nr:hypothetical protein [Alistipes sp.]
MRKIFSMILVALVAMFTATSCQLSSGTDPNPNRKNNLLWGRVNDAINQHYDHFRAVAHLNDVLLDRDYVESAYKQCEIVEGTNAYTLMYDSSYNSYRITTDGKRLDEGGVWTIYYRTSPYMEFGEVGKAIGIEGESSKFNLVVDNSHWGYTYYANSYTADSEIEYEYNDVVESLCVKFNTFKGFCSDEPTPTEYVIEFEVVEPLYIRASIEQGKIDILYRDLVKNTSRELTVEIENRIVTFATSKVE